MNDDVDVRNLLKLVDNLGSEKSDERANVESPQPTDDLLSFRDLVIEEALISFVSGKYFNIFQLDRTADAIDARLGRPSRNYGEKTPVRAAIEPALNALHCVDFDKMSASLRAGLPNALLAHFGLDEASGEAMLGQEGWARVASAYQAFAAPAVESASGPAPELMSRGFSEHPIASGPVRAVTVLLFTALVFYGLWRGTVHLVQWIRIH